MRALAALPGQVRGMCTEKGSEPFTSDIAAPGTLPPCRASLYTA